ncbi:MAG TPA: 50S ribosomal protein L23 [Candidatus Limnocylindrales bacterium]
MSALSAAEVVLRPVVSEKSIDQSTLTDRNPKSGNKYTFRVHPAANKIQIKAAIESLYEAEKITVVSVNVLTRQPKTTQRGTKRGRITGRVSGWRKAVVTLAPGQKIQFFEGV